MVPIKIKHEAMKMVTIVHLDVAIDIHLQDLVERVLDNFIRYLGRFREQRPEVSFLTNRSVAIITEEEFQTYWHRIRNTDSEYHFEVVFRDRPIAHIPPAAPQIPPVENRLVRAIPPIRVFSFLALDHIPAPLHDDRVFRMYICAIMLTPIRFPVRDPNGRTLYERANIIRWLGVSARSPTTGRALLVRDLQEVPAVQAIIDARLQYYENELWNLLAASRLLRRALTLPPAEEQMNAAETEHKTQ